jgi:NAD(P)-dependent dehydrogenase (short-subunit alcohol dehydrogenase family)
MSGQGRLEGKVILLTGTGSGMGQAIAIEFARQGAKVYGCDLSEESIAKTDELAKQEGLTLFNTAPVDLGDPDQCQKWVESVGEKEGHVDALFNNASGPVFAPMPEMTIEQWHKGVRNEIDLVFYATKFAWPYLAKAKHGVIISTGSTAAHIAQPNAGFASHCAAKGAVVSMTKAFAADGKKDGIRAVCLSPGGIRTPETERNFLNKVPNGEEMMKQMLPSSRFGEVSDVTGIAVFLASDESLYVNGSEFLVDGGFTSI